MSSVLDSIINGVREDLAERKKLNPNPESEIKYATPVKNAEQALSKKDISIIAEVKRSSPSKGELAQISDPAKLAKEYENAGESEKIHSITLDNIKPQILKKIISITIQTISFILIINLSKSKY